MLRHLYNWLNKFLADMFGLFDYDYPEECKPAGDWDTEFHTLPVFDLDMLSDEEVQFLQKINLYELGYLLNSSKKLKFARGLENKGLVRIVVHADRNTQYALLTDDGKRILYEFIARSLP